MSSWDIIKTVVLLIVMFPFIVLLSYFGYLVLFGGYYGAYPSVWFTPGNAGFQALASGCAVGLAVGTLVGYRIGTEKESTARELA